MSILSGGTARKAPERGQPGFAFVMCHSYFLPRFFGRG